MGPFPVFDIFGHFGGNLVYLLIGIGFGAVLEMSGFGDSPKLAAQFYFKDMTVLKVMFTAIIVAMLLIFAFSGLSLLDYDKIWVNPTYLWPGIVGGLIMGFGFIIGGYCPGTSLVGMATLKLDGLFFVLGAVFGIFLFGETVSLFDGFWNSSYMGRFTIPDWLGIPTGAVVVLVILMALFMFWGGEHLERIFGGKDLKKEPKARYVGAFGLFAVAVGILVIGQPTLAEKWDHMPAEKKALLTEHQVQIQPGELLSLIKNDDLNLIMLDVREESDYNLFHLKDAKLIERDQIKQTSYSLADAPLNTVVVVMCNNEVRSTKVWKDLMALNVSNVYILEGGINAWLDTFGHEGHENCTLVADPVSENLHHTFKSALGSNQPAAEPDVDAHSKKIHYTPKVKLEKKVTRQGGCG